MLKNLFFFNLVKEFLNKKLNKERESHKNDCKISCWNRKHIHIHIHMLTIWPDLTWPDPRRSTRQNVGGAYNAWTGSTIFIGWSMSAENCALCRAMRSGDVLWCTFSICSCTPTHWKTLPQFKALGFLRQREYTPTIYLAYLSDAGFVF